MNRLLAGPRGAGGGKGLARQALVVVRGQGRPAANRLDQRLQRSGSLAVSERLDTRAIDHCVDRRVRPIEDVDPIVPEQVIQPDADIVVHPLPVRLGTAQHQQRIVPDGDRLLVESQLIHAAADGLPRLAELALDRDGVAARGCMKKADGRQQGRNSGRNDDRKENA
jgi:hypothetical protein